MSNSLDNLYLLKIFKQFLSFVNVLLKIHLMTRIHLILVHSGFLENVKAPTLICHSFYLLLGIIQFHFFILFGLLRIIKDIIFLYSLLSINFGLNFRNFILHQRNLRVQIDRLVSLSPKLASLTYTLEFTIFFLTLLNIPLENFFQTVVDIVLKE